MYFRLFKHCILVEGAKCGAIYDLQSGKVLSLNQGAVQLLKECQGSALADIMDIAVPQNASYLQFLDGLVAKGLGSIFLYEHDLPYPMEPVDPVTLHSVVLEITARCNNTCIHCYTNSGPNVSEDRVPHERWLSTITEARQAGAASLQLIGGEPLLYPKWRELVLRAKEVGFESIEIFTNATLITETDIAFFKTNDVIISTSLYAGSAEVHDKVTLNPGSFEKTIASIEKILMAGVPLRVYSVIMKTNETEFDNIIRLCDSLGLEGIAPPAIRPVGRGKNEQLRPETYTGRYIKPPFYTGPVAFAKAHQYHSTLAGTITIAFTGDVIPCIFARTRICGNILASSLVEIVKNDSVSCIWQTTKDHVAKCKDCEYRYACLDCRCHSATGDDAKGPACPTACTYNPYTGMWDGEEKKEGLPHE